IAGALEAVYYAPLTAIARIHGACLGGSCLLASACDLRYAAADAILGIPVAKLGIVLDDGCVNRLADLVGTARARELLFSGCTISGVEAQSIGLVNKAMEEAELTAFTLTQAKTIAANSSNTIKEVKQSLSRRRRSPDSEVLLKQMERIRNSYLSTEFKERLSKL
ncbi:MAG TPA: enoyl-CoA hydratase-related protein, partial [Candidatus Obscuribacter sp.]|nr:enoyl-CoA hydratase-related protein [Candidatus Obscuribacter sp.]